MANSLEAFDENKGRIITIGGIVAATTFDKVRRITADDLFWLIEKLPEVF